MPSIDRRLRHSSTGINTYIKRRNLHGSSGCLWPLLMPLGLECTIGERKMRYVMHVTFLPKSVEAPWKRLQDFVGQHHNRSYRTYKIHIG